MSKTLLPTVNENDPFAGLWQVKHTKTKQINGVNYKKISYKKDHGLLWRIGHLVLGILASISIIPLLIDHKSIMKLFKRVKTGEEIKVILKPEEDIKQEQNSKSPVDQDAKNNKHVHFNEVRGRLFDKNENPQSVAEAHSMQMKDLKKENSQPLSLSPEAIKEKLLQEQWKNLSMPNIPPPPTPTQLPAPQTRRIPPLSFVDTFRFDEGIKASVHGKGELFEDNEILEKEEVVRSNFLENVEIFYTKYNKPILQQQATRGCTAAATGMLILDNNGKVNVSELRSTNLGDNFTKELSIRRAGFSPILTHHLGDNYLEGLKKLIDKNGSAIVSIGGDIGSHVVVVDSISPFLDRVRLRDPYHGWEITVSGSAFMNRNPKECMQISKKR